jgi:hypothetical protein
MNIVEKRNRKLRYRVSIRVKHIFDMVWKHGGIKKAAPHIISKYTGKPMTYIGIRDYLNTHGFKIVFGPYLTDLQGNIIDPESLTEENNEQQF